ncbi:disease resistance protein RPV1-like [Alnus glutinosa]|uniref:disease resistance protein RPV1-like n=1 Tax=Alnus glutinosa TaxID=3517 RepID=UPI002D768F14|nr:disease resistance protein RPV1-like [Alnus glutinosa]
MGGHTQGPSSSSSPTPQWIYKVFLNFCGCDTRRTFTDHLYAALKRDGIIVFRDNENLNKGNYIPNELVEAIQKSLYATVIISKNYAFSKWCLSELVQIVRCMRDMGLTVLPIFYHVDPSHVKKQTGIFAKAFAIHERDPKVDSEMLQKWRASLRKVGKISGWHVQPDTYESTVVKEISTIIRSGLRGNTSNVFDTRPDGVSFATYSMFLSRCTLRQS